jgi:hypothetical protein
MRKQRTIGDANASKLSHLLTELAKEVSNSLGDSRERATEVPGLTLIAALLRPLRIRLPTSQAFLLLRKEVFEGTWVARATSSADRDFSLLLWNCRL